MTALMDAFVGKPLNKTYREAVADKCYDLVKRITSPSDAVKYVVALGKRGFLWDVLLREAADSILKRGGENE